MKLLFAAFLFVMSAHADTPLDMKLGYWEYKIDLASSPMMQKAMASLAKLPKPQRDQIMKKMGVNAGSKKTYQCFTAEDMKNWKKKLSGMTDNGGCKMIVKKSTKTVFEAIRKCQKGGDMEMFFKMVSDKEGDSVVKLAMSPNPIKTKMTWVSSNCPKKNSK